MLYQIGLAHPKFRHIVNQFVHHIQLMVARENQLLGILHYVRHFLLCLCLIVIEAYIVHYYVGNHILLQDSLPHIRCLVSAIGIHRVSCALTIWHTLVERHEISLTKIEPCGKKHLVLVHCKMSKTTTKIEQSFLWIALYRPVLLLPIVFCGLVCPRIFKFEGKQWQTVNKQHNIYFQPRICNRKSLLAGKRELILRIFPF